MQQQSAEQIVIVIVILCHSCSWGNLQITLIVKKWKKTFRFTLYKSSRTNYLSCNLYFLKWIGFLVKFGVSFVRFFTSILFYYMMCYSKVTRKKVSLLQFHHPQHIPWLHSSASEFSQETTFASYFHSCFMWSSDIFLMRYLSALFLTLLFYMRGCSAAATEKLNYDCLVGATADENTKQAFCFT